MELCDGNLHDYVKKWKSIDRPDIDRMVLGQIVVALQHLRSLDIAHKDLNPNNVLFKQTGCDVVLVKLADFGISKQKKYGKECFSVTRNKGTPGYISPELLDEEDKKLEANLRDTLSILGNFYIQSYNCPNDCFWLVLLLMLTQLEPSHRFLVRGDDRRPDVGLGEVRSVRRSGPGPRSWHQPNERICHRNPGSSLKH